MKIVTYINTSYNEQYNNKESKIVLPLNPFELLVPYNKIEKNICLLC